MVDELALEATKEYSERMGRWRTRALAVVSSQSFWCSMNIMHRCRGPLIHFSSFLKQVDENTDEDTGTYKVVAMVSFRCQQVMTEFFALLAEGLPPSCYPVDMDMDGDKKDFFLCLTFRILCKHACQFHRRLAHSANTFPLRLFVLVMHAPHIKCAERKQVATELCLLINQLQSDRANEVDTVTAKILQHDIFRTQIQQAAVSGVLGEELFTFLALIAKVTKIDVRENERVNKLLSLLGERCPNSNLEPRPNFSQIAE